MDEGQTVVLWFIDVTTIRILIRLYLYCNNPRNSTPEWGFIFTSKRGNLQHELSLMAKDLVLWSTLTAQNPFPLIQKYQLRIVTLTSPRNSTWEVNQKTRDENQILWTQKNLEFFLGMCMNTSSVLGFYSFLLQRTMTWGFFYVLFHVLGNWESNNKVQGSLPSLSINSYCPIISLVHFHVCGGLVCQENSTWGNLWLKHKNENDNCLWQWM